jgi:hypothetical protein
MDLGMEPNQIQCQNGETYCMMGTYQVFFSKIDAILEKLTVA